MKNIVIIAILLGTFITTNAQEALAIKSTAPNFRAITTEGKSFDLAEVTRDKQVVLFFYRGQWCPYCNKQMSELQDSLQFITDLGATVIAITPEKPEEAAKSIDKTGATFDIIYDENHTIMDLYKVTFTLSKVKQVMYKGYGIDINNASGNNDNALPVPATYIIDRNGKIKSRFFSEDYKNRMSVKQIIENLKQ